MKQLTSKELAALRGGEGEGDPITDPEDPEKRPGRVKYGDINL